MAKCQACGKEMLTASGCDFRYAVKNDKFYKRRKVGDEGWYSKGQRCGDCGAKYGHYHHPGCDIEPCPICGGQLISCDCEIEVFATGKE